MSDLTVDSNHQQLESLKYRNTGDKSHVSAVSLVIGRDWFRRVYESRMLTFSSKECTVGFARLDLRSLDLWNFLEEWNVDSNLNLKVSSHYLNTTVDDVEARFT